MADDRTQKKLAKGHHESAIKRARQIEKRTARRRMLLSTMRTQIKKLRISLAKKDKKEAAPLLQAALPLIAKMAGKKLLHHRTAARYTSRLTRQFNAL